MFFRVAQLSFAVVIACTLACGGEPSTTSGDEEDEPGNFDEGTGLGEGECSDVCGTPECGVCPSADMVDGGGFQIDATEVTNAQYAQMLGIEFDAGVLPSGCEWKSSFEPEGWDEAAAGEIPVTGVDWCDAMVFCSWADKELCGAVGGGAGEFDVGADAEADAWYRACSNAGATEFPYGADYDPLACNGAESGQDALLAVATLDTCEGGVSGLFDMSGNVWEWSNACESSGGDGNTKCRRRGGSRYTEAEFLGCTVNSSRARGERDNAVGFRCCES